MSRAGIRNSLANLSASCSISSVIVRSCIMTWPSSCASVYLVLSAGISELTMKTCGTPASHWLTASSFLVPKGIRTTTPPAFSIASTKLVTGPGGNFQLLRTNCAMCSASPRKSSMSRCWKLTSVSMSAACSKCDTRIRRILVSASSRFSSLTGRVCRLRWYVQLLPNPYRFSVW